MKKLLLSLLTISAVGVIAFVGTNAFFNDTETSEGNLFQAGSFDLTIDNKCYYNGRACVEGQWEGEEEPQGPCFCNWDLTDLDEKNVFFHFRDLKPGDWEEDTISVHVDNEAWLCLDIVKTNDDDNTCTEPETEDEPLCQPGTDGELDDELKFVFWRDDGDNVFEEHEGENSIITAGSANDVLADKRWALADSQHGPGPIPGGQTVYIGKFFCYGDITPNPVPDDDGEDPTVASGFDCDGKPVDNKSQTDVLEGDLVFYAEQARHNKDFLCNPLPTPEPTELPNPSGEPGPT